MNARRKRRIGAVVAIAAMVLTCLVAVGSQASAAIDCDLHPESPLCTGGPIDPCVADPARPGCTDPGPGPCPEVVKDVLGYALQPVVGATLWAASFWTGADHISYRWLVGGAVVGTSERYQPVAADVGKPLVLEATGSSDCGASTTASTAPRTVSPGTMGPGERAQNYEGEARVGGSLTAVAAEPYGTGPLTVEFRWFRDDLKTPLGTGTEYHPVVADLGHRILLMGQYLRPGYNPYSVVTPVHPEVGPGPAARNARRPAIAGAARYTGVLRVTPGHWSISGPVHFQWLRNGTPIAGATAPTYRPRVGDVGKSIAVRETSTPEGHDAAIATSSAVRIAHAGRLVHRKGEKAPATKGRYKVGKVLRARKGKVQMRAYFTPAATRVRFQWLRDGKAIKGATKRGYRLRKADRGHRVKVRVIATRPGYINGTWSMKGKRVR